MCFDYAGDLEVASERKFNGEEAREVLIELDDGFTTVNRIVGEFVETLRGKIPINEKMEALFEVTTPLKGRLGNDSFVINYFRVPLTVWHEEIQAKTIMSSYQDSSGKVFAWVGHCEIHATSGAFLLVITEKDYSEASGCWTLTWERFTLDRRPYPVPDNLKLHFIRVSD
jgi:hypothetical protein